jgi:hypothetical protein
MAAGIWERGRIRSAAPGVLSDKDLTSLGGHGEMHRLDFRRQFFSFGSPLAAFRLVIAERQILFDGICELAHAGDETADAARATV